jgi:t-SNARE complex subunit (syntaxin)
MSQEWTPPPSEGAPAAAVPNYLVLAIISLVCCLPLGIVAVVFAARVNGQVQAGDTAGALESSRKAKLFSYISIGLGLVWIIIWIVMTVLGVGIGALSNT